MEIIAGSTSQSAYAYLIQYGMQIVYWAFQYCSQVPIQVYWACAATLCRRVYLQLTDGMLPGAANVDHTCKELRWAVVVSSLNGVWLLQAHGLQLARLFLSMGFPQQEYWEIPCTEEPAGYSLWGHKRVRLDCDAERDEWYVVIFPVCWLDEFFFLRIKKIGQLPLSSRNHSGKAFYYGFNLLNTKLF